MNEPLATIRRGSGMPLLLVHGFTGCAEDWRHLFPEPPPGRELLAVDLPGHGRSSFGQQEPVDEFSFSGAARRLVKTLEVLEAITPPLDAIGLSGGALTLLHLALIEPSLLRRQVLVSATTTFPPQARRIMATIDPETQPESEWQLMRERHPNGDEQIRHLWRMSRNLRHSGSDVDFTPAQLARIETSTLVVHGDRDPLYPLPLALQLYAGLADARLWVVPGGEHAPIFGPEADAFRARALDFLAR